MFLECFRYKLNNKIEYKDSENEVSTNFGFGLNAEKIGMNVYISGDTIWFQPNIKTTLAESQFDSVGPKVPECGAVPIY